VICTSSVQQSTRDQYRIALYLLPLCNANKMQEWHLCTLSLEYEMELPIRTHFTPSSFENFCIVVQCEVRFLSIVCPQQTEALGSKYTSLILEFHLRMNIDFWFWGFCTVCEINFPKTFRGPMWVPKPVLLFFFKEGPKIVRNTKFM
jgi:hypothetical protein